MQNIEKFEKFIISQKGLLIRDGKALLMEMTKNPGYWDLPGGRVDIQEDAKLAFKREMLEETGVKEFINLGVVHYHLWYVDDDRIAVGGIVSLIENDKDKIVISPEHIKCSWISEDEIDKYDYWWPEMHLMIKKGFEKYKLLK